MKKSEKEAVASDTALSAHHDGMPAAQHCPALSLCERDHRLRLRFARTNPGEHILLHIDNYYRDKPNFDQLNGIDNMDTVIWIDTDYWAYSCNQSAYKQFLKIGHVFLDKRSFPQYNLWLISRYNANYSCSDDSDEHSKRDNHSVNTWGVSFLLKMIRREMKKISTLPGPKCQSQRLATPDICTVEAPKKSKKNKMKNDHNDKSTTNCSTATMMPEEKTREASHPPLADNTAEKAIAPQQVNQTQGANALKQHRKRQHSDKEAFNTAPDADISDTLSILSLAKRQKVDAGSKLKKTKPLNDNDTASNNAMTNQRDEDNSRIQSTGNKIKKNQIPAIKATPSCQADSAGSLTTVGSLTVHQSKRKKIKRPNIVVGNIDPHHSLCWNMGNYIVNTFFNDNSCQVDSKEMLRKFSKKAKRRRDRICYLWQKCGEAFFDAQYSANPSCYIEVSSEMLRHDLDIPSDYETLLKILNGIGARFDTSVKRNMIDNQSFESHFTLHVKDFFDLLRHLDDELMADWYEIYYKNQMLYMNTKPHPAAGRHDEKMDVDDN